MPEDKLSPEERLRLEALALSIQSDPSVSTPILLARATAFAAFIETGSTR